MTHKQDLEALLDNVKSGISMHAEYKAAFPDMKMHELACLAYNGSLDAAQELHEAVLVDRWMWSAYGLGTAYLFNPTTNVVLYADAINPARAWLIAILEALISECEE